MAKAFVEQPLWAILGRQDYVSPRIEHTDYCTNPTPTLMATGPPQAN